jgi:hypothetical protein
VQFTQQDCAIVGFDVTKHPAGADRGELLIITDQPNTAAAADDELDGVSRERVSAIPASSMITNVDRPMRCAQSRSSAWLMSS